MMAAEDEERFGDRISVEDNYYSLLGVGKEATPEEIVNQYRRLSKIFHPDKHTDEQKKRDAQAVFNKVKKAYEVLVDENKRAIYDTLGVRGLETDGWQIVQRDRTAQQIREEYERLVKQKEEQRLQQQTNPQGTILVQINATELFERVDDDDDEYDEPHIPTPEISSMSISQQIEMPLASNNTAVLGGSLQSSNGRGHGQFITSLRHIVSAKTWVEMQFIVGQGPTFNFKGFRTISKRSFATASAYFMVTNGGIAPGCEVVLGKQLSKQVVGYLTWKGGIQQSMNSSLVWNSPDHHFLCGIQAGVKSSYLNFSYTRKLESGTKFRGGVKVGTNDVSFEYGCETKLSDNFIVGATMIVSIPSGVTLKLKASRAKQNFVFHVLLSEQLQLPSIFYGTLIPIVTFYSLKVFVINPFLKQEKLKEVEKARAENAAKLREKRKQAEATRYLLQETYRRVLEQETERNGLIIIKALYGPETPIEEFSQSTDAATTEADPSKDLLDVTVQLQCLVKDSSLSLPAVSKSDLPGFYDPCLGETKSLFIKYRFRGLVHQALIDDSAAVAVPHSSHLGP